MSDGGTLLTNGSFADLWSLGITPNEGMRLGFYDLDADDQNRPTFLCADGVLHFDNEHRIWEVDNEHRIWEAFVDPQSFRSVPRTEVGD